MAIFSALAQKYLTRIDASRTGGTTRAYQSKTDGARGWLATIREVHSECGGSLGWLLCLHSPAPLHGPLPFSRSQFQQPTTQVGVRRRSACPALYASALGQERETAHRHTGTQTALSAVSFTACREFETLASAKASSKPFCPPSTRVCLACTARELRTP